MNERIQRFREAIAGFIEERRDAKLKGEEGAEAASKYQYDTWLADAARRVGQIQAVTHVLKATHPDAKGSSLHVQPRSLPQRPEVGSHVLGDGAAEDIVGNAAALDVYKLLKLEVDGKRLLDWIQQDDPDAVAALSKEPAVAAEHAAAFRALVRPVDTYASHVSAKQLYWCVGERPADDSHYHLLQPMFPSSLLHAVHAEIQNSRFGEQAREADKARRDRKPHPVTVHQYRELCVRKLGGTKPQNVSQLNSERGGINYLLASLPPEWRQDRPRNFLFVDSAVPRILYYENTAKLVDGYIKHLKSYDQRRMEQTKTRERMERRLGVTLAAFGAATTQLFDAGWTRDADCQLPLCEQLWLDPGRADLDSRDENDDLNGHLDDEAFKRAYEAQDWPDEIASRFAEWLNAQLRKHDLPVGDVELRHFARQAVIDAVEWANPIRRDLPGARRWAKAVTP